MGWDDALATRAQIARRLRVAPRQVDAWAGDATTGFPAPRGRAGRLVMWSVDEVVRWAELGGDGPIPLGDAGPGLRLPPPDPALTPLVGREHELKAVGAELVPGCLVVLTGPAGVGKTRLALELGRSTVSRFPDGTRLVELAGIADPALVPQAFTAALGVTEQPDLAPEDTIAGALQGRRTLLVVDNCEHLADAVRQVLTAIHERCPAVTVLATSQADLEIPEARTWPVATLPVPEEDASLEAMRSSPAVSLFCSRAAAASPGFSLVGEAARVVAGICRRLDGIPLAIELAAARGGVLTPAEIAERLDTRFVVLTRGNVSGSPRHATLERALDWSHDLLSRAEQVLFRRLSVFAGECELDAVDVVCGQIPGGTALDPLAGLVAKSLLLADTSGPRARYRMLESVRLYAAQRLAEAGEEPAIRRRHAAWFLGIAVAAEPKLTGPDQLDALRTLDRERVDLRAALQWALGERHGELALRLAGAQIMYWRVRCSFREGRDALAAALTIGSAQPAAQRAWATWGCGWMMLMLLDPRSSEPLQASLAMARTLRDRVLQARSLLLLGNQSYLAGEAGAALEELERSATLAREIRDAWCLSHALGMSARVLVDDGDLAGARIRAEECVGAARRAGEMQGLRLGLLLLGEIDVSLGNYASAEAAIEEGTAIGRDLGEPYLVAGCLMLTAEIHKGRGQHAAAARLLDEAAALDRGSGWTLAIGQHLLRGSMAMAIGDPGTARAQFEDACALAEARSGAQTHLGLLGLALVSIAAGDEVGAQSLLERARPVSPPGRPARCRMLAEVTAALGRLARERGDRQRAVGLHCEALAMHSERGHAPGIVQAIEDLAVLRIDAGTPAQAVRLLGAAQALRESRGFARWPVLDAQHVSDVAAAREALGSERFQDAWSEGATLALAEAADYAVKGWGPKPRNRSGWEALTRTERAIVGLVREGLTNRQIADRLFVSPRTVDGHIANIYAKVGVRSRVRLAAEATHRDV
ncbi:MAG TPA: LuxR C-terminal-related transcriptional regulator [Candidatus Dormibacteraeota bacterium]|nr:LuxR C-terminal-related transcriptional regulator [Candidatus Dormibacteraeota bacterium]